MQIPPNNNNDAALTTVGRTERWMRVVVGSSSRCGIVVAGRKSDSAVVSLRSCLFSFVFVSPKIVTKMDYFGMQLVWKA